MKILLLCLLVAASPPANRPDEVFAFHCGAPERVASANVRDVYAAYGSRSVAIIEAAIARDEDGLAEMVAPTATFTVFQGDVGVGPKSVGPNAAIAFAEQLSPLRYQFSAGSAGPFSMDPCGPASAELTLFGGQSDEAVVTTFKYRDGILAEVQGSRVELIGGDFPKRSTR